MNVVRTTQRLAFRELPNGRWEATVTVLLPHGETRVFTADAGPGEIGASTHATDLEVARWWLSRTKSPKAHILSDSAALTWYGSFSAQLRKALRNMYNDHHSGSIFDRAASGVKKIATSKVFLVAAAGLALAIPFAGPIVGPLLASAAAGMGVASKLIKAGEAAAKGAVATAKQLTSSAVADARRLTKTPEQASALLAIANGKRKAVERVVATVAAGKPEKPSPPQPKTNSALLAAAAAGKLRSNVGGPVPAESLLAAADRGDVFWSPSSDVLAAARFGRVHSHSGASVAPSSLLEASKAGRVYWVAA